MGFKDNGGCAVLTPGFEGDMHSFVPVGCEGRLDCKSEVVKACTPPITPPTAGADCTRCATGFKDNGGCAVLTSGFEGDYDAEMKRTVPVGCEARQDCSSKLADVCSTADASGRSTPVSKERTIVLHIGGPKTGSTYLQHLFYANVDVLEAAGVAYPAVNESCNEANHYLTASLCNCNPFNKKPLGEAGPPVFAALDGVGDRVTPQFMAELSRQLDSHDGDVILSSETLFDAGTFLHLSVEVVRQWLYQYATRVKVVSFYRERKDLMISLFRQNIQSMELDGGSGDVMQMHWNDQLRNAGLPARVRNADLPGLEFWVQFVGRENIVMLDYAGVTASGINLAKALLEAGQLPIVNFTNLPDTVNPSIDDDEVAARQLWAVFAHTVRGPDFNFNCTISISAVAAAAYNASSAYMLNFTSLPLSSWGHPKRCSDLSGRDDEFIAIDAGVYSTYSDLVRYSIPAANRSNAIRSNKQVCELDVQAVLNDQAKWLPRFKQQLEALPHGACMAI